MTTLGRVAYGPSLRFSSCGQLAGTGVPQERSEANRPLGHFSALLAVIVITTLARNAEAGFETALLAAAGPVAETEEAERAVVVALRSSAREGLRPDGPLIRGHSRA